MQYVQFVDVQHVKDMRMEIIVTAESDDGLIELFDIFINNSKPLEEDEISFSAKSVGSVVAGAGLPEITELVLALGTAGVFTALVKIFTDYFKTRPTGKIVLKKSGETITFTAENCDAEKVASTLGDLMNSK